MPHSIPLTRTTAPHSFRLSQQGRLSTFLMALCVLFLGFPAQSQSPQGETALLTQSLKRLETLTAELQHEKQQTDAEILQLKEEEQALRQKLKDDLATFHTTTERMVKLQRIPREALMAQGALTLSHKREKLLEKGQVALQERLKHATTAIHDLLKVQGNVHLHMQRLAVMEKDVIHIRTATQQLLLEKQNRTTLSDSKRAALLKDVQSVARAADLNRFFSQRAAASSWQLSEAVAPLLRDARLPVTGRVVRRFKEADRLGLHPEGIDIRTTAGAEVRAVSEGTVVYSGKFGDYDHVVIIAHDENIHSVYGNLHQARVKEGDKVSAITVIGTLSETMTPELYLEVRENGKTIDPLVWLKHHKVSS